MGAYTAQSAAYHAAVPPPFLLRLLLRLLLMPMAVPALL